MGGEGKLDKMDDGELEEVVGGYGRVVDKGDGYYEFWFQCSCCGDYAELISKGHESIWCTETGTFVCPKCGWKKDYTLECNSYGVRAYSPTR